MTPPRNPFEDLILGFGLGLRVNHLSFQTPLNQTLDFNIANERHFLLYATAFVRLNAAAPVPAALLELEQFTWIIRHNKRTIPLIRSIGAFAPLLSMVAAGQVGVAYEGTTTDGVVWMRTSVPIFEVVDGGTIEVGMTGGVLANSWQRAIDLVTMNVTGLARAYPRSREDDE